LFLSKLELHGFKSFPQKTVVNFDRGLTAVVGPNGCGKTNIVDAIRWCLGEQKSSALRSGKMEDVIFNGTSGRKPMGMAEVSLTIQNDRGKLPSEYSEILVTRRIFRSNESEYLLNKNLCRLKDITNLFMDTGMGSDAYSVIELKMVESILSSKTEDRRRMFEEAAGVNQYKSRRKTALNKLDAVKSDLTRVNDIVSEVEKKVASLERQAKKADRFMALSKEREEIELDYAGREFSRRNRERERWETRRRELDETLERANRAVDELETKKRSIREALGEKENALKLKRAEIAGQVEKIHGVETNISGNRATLGSLERNIERYEREALELAERLERAERSVEENRARVESVAKELEETERRKAETDERAKEAERALEEKRDALKRSSDNNLERFRDLTGKQNELGNLERAKEAAEANARRLDEKIRTLTGEMAKSVGYVEDLAAERDSVREQLEDAEKIFETKRREKEEYEKELNRLRERELEAKSALNDLKARVEFLRNLIENLEGFSKGAKALMDDPSSWAKRETNLLANIGGAEEESRFAVEAALRNNINNIIVRSIEEIKRAAERLRDERAGKATFYVYGDENRGGRGAVGFVENFLSDRKTKKLRKEPGFRGWAADFVKTEKRWEPFFRRFLGKTAVVENLETALELADRYPQFNFATLAGDYVHQSGVVEAGSEPTPDDTIFGRKLALEEALGEVPKREAALEERRRTIAEIEEKMGAIDLRTLDENARMLRNDLSGVEANLKQMEFERGKAVEAIEEAREESQKESARAEELSEKRDALAEELERLNAEKADADRAHEALEEEFNAAAARHNEANAARNALELERERKHGERKRFENDVANARDTIETTTQTAAKRREDIESAKREIVEVREAIERAEEDLRDLAEVKSAMNEEESRVESEAKAIAEEIGEVERKIETERAEKERRNNERHAAEMRLNEIDMIVRSLVEHIREKYDRELEVAEYEDENQYDFDARKAEIHDLERKINNLGPVNTLAYDEFAEEKERLDFLSGQREDLLESEKDLIKTIEEINEQAQKIFRDTFEEIRENFIKVFRSLFNPGDEADLKLEEGVDPLEARVEIIAKPKGKRPTSIELLSGGEKTLTAIALLFAIYLVKPSPFCILDEIDAPLDDANIDRFTKILREFSEGTQFIVVTHNKRTMEAADALYGVTMQEEGASKLVSVKFDEDFELAG
jgi:chromosome segregation protein